MEPLSWLQYRAVSLIMTVLDVPSLTSPILVLEIA
jgi:hypothetical protein